MYMGRDFMSYVCVGEVSVGRVEPHHSGYGNSRGVPREVEESRGRLKGVLLSR